METAGEKKRGSTCAALQTWMRVVAVAVTVVIIIIIIVIIYASSKKDFPTCRIYYNGKLRDGGKRFTLRLFPLRCARACVCGE